MSEAEDLKTIAKNTTEIVEFLKKAKQVIMWGAVFLTVGGGAGGMKIVNIVKGLMK